jgi:hypothetical protein
MLFGTAGFGVELFLVLILVLLVTTLGIMSILVSIAYFGIDRMRFTFLDRFEKLVIGLVLMGVAASMLLFHAGHDHDHEPSHGPEGHDHLHESPPPRR